MARRPRPQLAGAMYHVVQRGNYRQKIFLSDRDRLRFLEALGRYQEPLQYRIHAYCLLDNHVHLVMETKRPNLSRVLQRVFGSYTLYYNRKREKVGHLFQGRAKAFLVDSRAYLAEVSRYVHLNPVRAGLVTKPEAYTWSSLDSYLPGAKGKGWLTTERVLKRFEGNRARYMKFVYAGMEKEWKPTILQQVFLGGEAFAATMKMKLGWEEKGAERSRGEREGVATVKPDRILKDVAIAHRRRPGDLRLCRRRDPGLRHARETAMYVLRRSTPLTLAEIGKLLGGVSHARVSHGEASVRRSESALRGAERILRRIHKLHGA